MVATMLRQSIKLLKLKDFNSQKNTILYLEPCEPSSDNVLTIEFLILLRDWPPKFDTVSIIIIFFYNKHKLQIKLLKFGLLLRPNLMTWAGLLYQTVIF